MVSALVVAGVLVVLVALGLRRRVPAAAWRLLAAGGVFLVVAGLDPQPYDHSLGAVFTDLNGGGRPDLYVANDEDPNRLYVNERGGPLGFRFVDLAPRLGVADRYSASMART